MSSPFSRYMEGKNPVSKIKSEAAKRSGISDKEHHAISSNTDANSVMLDGSTYDKDYDKLTDAVGYVDPDVTITTSKPKQPELGGLKKSQSDVNMGSPANQTGYRGGGDVGSYYVPMAGVYQNLQDSISKNMAEVYKFQNYKGDAKKNLYTQDEVDKMLKIK